MFFGKKKPIPASPTAYTLDEFIDARSAAETREASPLVLDGKDWQAKLALASGAPRTPAELALPAFTLLRGGDLFEHKGPRRRTPPALIDRYLGAKLEVHDRGIARPERDAALAGLARVLSGNPAIVHRLLLARSIELVLVPKGADFRSFGFPPSCHPNAAGLFVSPRAAEKAQLGLREELILSMPHLVVHEAMHAIHLLALTAAELKRIDDHLVPVFRSRRAVEEVVAIYAERAFGATYGEADLAAPGIYGKVRREWKERSVFALFMAELLRPT